MKKIKLYIVIAAALTLLFTSCEKDEIGGTATESMSGEWVVTLAGIDSVGNVVYDDPRNYGSFHFDTYSTSANISTEMWIDDNENSWEFKNRITTDLSTLTFYADSAVDEVWGDIVHLTDGKIMLNAATTPSGATADSIVCEIWFAGDSYLGNYYDRYRLSGFRYTGLTTDE